MGDPKKELLQAFLASRSTVQVDVARGRKVYVNRSDGSVGEASTAEVLAGLLAKERVGVELDYRARDKARRASGLVDLCDDCGGDLPMTQGSASGRLKKPHPWRCRSCAHRRDLQPALCECGKQISRQAWRRQAAEGRRHLCRACWDQSRRSDVEVSCVGCGKSLGRSSPIGRGGERPASEKKCAECYRAELRGQPKICSGCGINLSRYAKTSWCQRCFASAANPDRPRGPSVKQLAQWGLDVAAACVDCGTKIARGTKSGRCVACCRRAPRGPMSAEQRAKISAKMLGNQNASGGKG
jgi:hypothetical protein